MRAFALLLACLFIALPISADDGAASIAVGGLVLMKREPRIVMAKEVLSISPDRVVVDYDFRNDSADDITTEVAFPIPEYVDDYDRPSAKWAGFDDFKLSVDGAPTKYLTETRAFTKKGEITQLLAGYGIDAATFGHEYQDKNGNIVNDLSRLSKAQAQRLADLHAVSGPNVDWSVRKKYHWTQTFPAHSTVHIRHEYTPVLGSSNTIGNPADFQGKGAVEEYASVCPNTGLRSTLGKVWDQQPKDPHNIARSPFWITYVDFILTTANTWKTPIEDFTLNIERPKTGEYRYYVSFCWDGAVTKADDNHFSAHASGLVPKKELRIGYIMSDAKKP